MSSVQQPRDCPLCHTPPSRLFRFVKDSFAYKYDLARDKLYSLYRCSCCGMVFVSPMPEMTDRGNLYRESVLEYETTLKTRHWRVLSLIKRLKPEGRLLEVGSSYGALLEILTAAGYSCEGIELDQKAVAFAKSKGLNIREGTVETTLRENDYEKYDIIVADNVLEHVAELRNLGILLGRCLSLGGVLLVICPNLNDYRRFLIPGWALKNHWHPVEHINYFTAETLRYFFRCAGLSAFAPHLKSESPSLVWRIKELLESLNVYSLGLYMAGRNVNKRIS